MWPIIGKRTGHACLNQAQYFDNVSDFLFKYDLILSFVRHRPQTGAHFFFFFGLIVSLFAVALNLSFQMVNFLEDMSKNS